MAIVDPRRFEHPFVSIPQLCFFFQLKRTRLLTRLRALKLEPARTVNGERFAPNGRTIYAARDVVPVLDAAALPIFLAWQAGDIALPSLGTTHAQPEPFTAVRHRTPRRAPARSTDSAPLPHRRT